MNKTILALLTCLHASMQLSAQESMNPVAKGNNQWGLEMMLAGSDVYWSLTTIRIEPRYRDLGLHLAPSYYKFLANGWSLGVQAHLGYESYHRKSDNSQNRGSYLDLGIVPMTRYYFNIGRNHKFKPYLLAGVPITYSRVTHQHSSIWSAEVTNRYRYAELMGTAGFGLAYFGSKGNIELNLSNMGLFLGGNRFSKPKVR